MIFVVVAVGIDIGLFLAFTEEITIFMDPMILVVLIVGFILYIVVHELLHGAAFMLFNRNTKQELKFGFEKKSGMAYCISTTPVKVPAARLSLMMPIYVVCIPMFVLGIVFNDIVLQVISIFFVSGSSGDVYYMWKLRKASKDHYMFEEMPTATGYEIGYKLYKKID